MDEKDFGITPEQIVEMCEHDVPAETEEDKVQWEWVKADFLARCAQVTDRDPWDLFEETLRAAHEHYDIAWVD